MLRRVVAAHGAEPGCRLTPSNAAVSAWPATSRWMWGGEVAWSGSRSPASSGDLDPDQAGGCGR
ncbi:hypothetical protein [Micromonospora taraxaci]|uniref:hypothetical protein n=1 Tax=Micromonospora taraxaci TaxID=1316803 RepID=UPI0033AC73D8